MRRDLARRMPSQRRPSGRAERSPAHCGKVASMQRRTFLKTLPFAAAAMTASAAEEIPVKLGFDTYSLRAFKWKGTQLLEYAAGLKLDTIQFSALADYGPLEPGNLQKVKDRA